MRRGQVTGIVLAAGLVLLLGLWHLTDVRAGVVASGDRWLYGYYIWLLLFGMVFLAMSGYQMCAGRQWSLERFFVWAALGLGIMFCIVLPPLSAPDEASHYISAYQLSNRLLGREACTEDSQVYIRPQDCLIEDMTDILKDDGQRIQGRTRGRWDGHSGAGADGGDVPLDLQGKAGGGQREHLADGGGSSRPSGGAMPFLPAYGAHHSYGLRAAGCGDHHFPAAGAGACGAFVFRKTHEPVLFHGYGLCWRSGGCPLAKRSFSACICFP